MGVQAQSGRMFFNGYNVVATSNYVYNSSGGTNATAGLFPAKADEVLVQYAVATLTATSLSFRIEGKFDKMDRWAEVYSKTQTSVTTVDQLVQVSERFSNIRVGAKINNDDGSNATNVFYAGLCLTEYK